MFENERKGWYGAYSISGKKTAEQFDEILRKDEIFNRINERKIKTRGFFEPDPDKNNLDYLYEDIKPFQIYHKEDKNFREKIEQTINNKNKKINSDKGKSINYLFQPKSKKEKDNAEDNEYYPKYDLIFPKTITGIKWNKLRGRKKNIKNININKEINNKCEKYNKKIKGKKQFLTTENKCFVDMDKYTKRADFIELKDIRIRYDKPFYKQDSHKNNVQESDNYITNQSSSNSSQGRDKIMKNSLLNIFIYNNIRNKKQQIFLDKSKSFINRKNNFGLKKSLSGKIQVPDFKKYLSRKYLENLRVKTGFEKNEYLSFLSLNYDLIREKNNSEIKFSHKKYKNKLKKFTGFDSISLIDNYKYIDKFNNHLSSKAPNIQLIPSRSYYENIKNNKDKQSDHLGNTYSSFYKKSFNNIINLKLMNSIFFERTGNNRIKKYVNKIKNNMHFNNKNYRQLIQEIELNQFDGITLKTLKRKNKENK